MLTVNFQLFIENILDKNIQYIYNYKGYAHLSQEQAINFRQQILKPLDELRDKIISSKQKNYS